MEKTRFMHQLDERFGEPIEKLLQRLYVEQRKSGIEISKQLGIKEPTVYKLLRWFSIPRRSISEACKGKKISKETREKMSKALKGRKITWGDKLSKAWRTREIPPEFGRRVSEGLKEYYKTHNPWNKGLRGVQKSTRKGKTWEEIYGMERAKEIKQKLRESLSKNKEKRRLVARERWKNPKYVKKTLSSLFQKPNKSERKLIEILQRHNLPFKYTGRGEFIIEGRVPDFIATNGSKKVIELFGRPWHDPNNGYHSSKIGYYRTEKGRKELFSRHGYTCLVIWADELRDEAKVVEKVNNFVKRDGCQAASEPVRGRG